MERKKIIENKTYFDLLEEKIPNLLEYIKQPKYVISDCDGILNDGKMHYTEEKKMFKSYGCHDKEMVSFFIKLGWKFLFVTNDSIGFQITKRRINDTFKKYIGNEVNLTECTAEERLKIINNIKSINICSKIIFCGDSLSDIPALSAADLAGTTNNAFTPVKEYCDYVSPYNGGEGGFADILYNLLDKTYDKND